MEVLDDHDQGAVGRDRLEQALHRPERVLSGLEVVGEPDDLSQVARDRRTVGILLERGVELREGDVAGVGVVDSRRLGDDLNERPKR